MKILKNYIPPDQVWLEWLKSEWAVRDVEGIKDLPEMQFIKEPQVLGAIPPLALLHIENIQQESQKNIVKILLFKDRHRILNKLPDDIQWYLFGGIGKKEFENIRIINEDTWSKSFPGDSISVRQVALMIENGTIDDYGHVKKIRAIQKDMRDGKAFDEKLILISGQKTSISPAVSILEGNHRAVAFVLEQMRTGGKSKYPKEVIVGISGKMKECCWYNYQSEKK